MSKQDKRSTKHAGHDGDQAVQGATPALVQGQLVRAAIARIDGRGMPVASTPAGHELKLPGGVPGDVVEARVVHVGQNTSWGRVHRVIDASEDRVEARCEVVDRCGGCPWQAMSADAQRRERLATLLGELRAGLRSELKAAPSAPEAATIHPWITGPGPYGYRTRSAMLARHIGGKLRLGFNAPKTNQLVAAEGCVVQHPRINEVLARVQTYLAEAGVGTWRDAERPGWLRAVAARLSPASGDVLVTLVVTEDRPELARLGRRILSIDGVTGVHANLHPEPGGPVMGAETIPVCGATRQRLRFGDMELVAGPSSFVQTQHEVAAGLLEHVLALAPAEILHLVDAYAGVGVFALALASRAKQVTAVEASRGAAADAAKNARLLGHAHVTVRAEDAATALPALVAEAGPDASPDVVVIDPPRAGCAAAVVEALCQLPGNPILLYVSCNPRSLARDVAKLVAEGGYMVTDVVPADMFPHTAHVEALVRLCRP